MADTEKYKDWLKKQMESLNPDTEIQDEFFRRRFYKPNDKEKGGDVQTSDSEG